MDAIVAEDLRKRYKSVQALDGVSFSVRDGEVFGLLGPNGAGKSTTVRTLTTLTQPDSGRAGRECTEGQMSSQRNSNEVGTRKRLAASFCERCWTKALAKARG